MQGLRLLPKNTERTWHRAYSTREKKATSAAISEGSAARMISETFRQPSPSMSKILKRKVTCNEASDEDNEAVRCRYMPLQAERERTAHPGDVVLTRHDDHRTCDANFSKLSSNHGQAKQPKSVSQVPSVTEHHHIRPMTDQKSSRPRSACSGLRLQQNIAS